MKSLVESIHDVGEEMIIDVIKDPMVLIGKSQFLKRYFNMKQLYDIVVEGILDNPDDIINKAHSKAEEVARINEIKSRLSKDFREYVEKKFKIKFVKGQGRDWSSLNSTPVAQYQASISHVQDNWWKNNRPKLVKELNSLGTKSNPNGMGYTDRHHTQEIQYCFHDDYVFYQVAWIFYNRVSKTLSFVASI